MLKEECHNPYFNRWFSAIKTSIKDVLSEYESHNPYFNRWFSAMIYRSNKSRTERSHNPYFNRWFSAIMTPIK